MNFAINVLPNEQAWHRTSLAVVAGSLLAACLPLAALAADPPPDPSTQVMTEQQIEQALHPATTRSLTFGSRGLTRRDAAETAPSINLNIPFEYNSSALQPQASAQLKQLESAFVSDTLRNDRFVVAGHTDAKGNPQYNKQLSLRRAETVKSFLVANGIAASRLSTVGYGSEQPLKSDQPDDAANRRVEIRDLGPAPGN
jgi:outer membrane protein OmpA-like peptidoglycan-associated protein